MSSYLPVRSIWCLCKTETEENILYENSFFLRRDVGEAWNQEWSKANGKKNNLYKTIGLEFER